MIRFNYVINKARSRTKAKNQNYMLVIVGPTGSGKSYAAIALAMMIDPNFTAERVCFRAEDFLETVGPDSDLDKGSVVVFDEAGIDVSSREWYTVRNKAINQTVETFRRDNLVCIWTTPVFSNIDKKSRSYFHGLGIMLDPDKAGGWGRMKYFDLVPKAQEGGVMGMYPKVSDDKNRPVQLSGSTPAKPNMIVPDPRKIGLNSDKEKGKKLIEVYEKKKKKFTDDIKAKGLEELREERRDEPEEIKLQGRDLIGFLANRYSKFPFDEDLSSRKLSRRVYSKMQTMTDENTNFSKNEIKNVVGYLEENPSEAKEMTTDPMEDREMNEQDIDLEKMKPAFKEMRGAGNSTRKIAQMWGVKPQKLYNKWRKWRAEGDMESDEVE